MIEARGLVKRYGRHLAVDDVSFKAVPGEVLGLLGPNGAGKSTIMRILAGYLTSTDGQAAVGGFDVQRQSIEVRRRLGYLPENAGLYLEMRVSEYLRYRAALRGVSPKLRQGRIDAVVASCGIDSVYHRIIGQLSKGYRQRVLLAATLIAEPDVLILDEPTVGLDPVQQREIQGVVQRLGKERTVLFSTHILSEAETVCPRVVIIDRGRVLADGVPQVLAERFRSQSLHIEARGDAGRIVAALQTLGGLECTVVRKTPTLIVSLRVENAQDPGVRAQISERIVAAGGLILELSFKGTSLDEVFRRVTANPEQASGPH